MKTPVLFAMAALIVGANASARSLARYEYAQLNDLDLDRNLNFSNEAQAQVRLDYAEKTVRLLIVDANRKVDLVLPIVREEMACGSYVSIARKDDSRLNGNVSEIVVQDNRSRKCRDLRPGTEVTYTVTRGGIVGRMPREIRSVLSGENLSLKNTADRSADLDTVEAKGFGGEIIDGNLALNTLERKLTLSFVNDICPANNAGVRCMAEPIAQSVELEIKSVESAGCGSMRYIAERNLLLVDGSSEHIEVIDHSTRKCMDTLPSQVEVRYTRVSGRSLHESSVRFVGNFL